MRGSQLRFGKSEKLGVGRSDWAGPISPCIASLPHGLCGSSYQETVCVCVCIGVCVCTCCVYEYLWCVMSVECGVSVCICVCVSVVCGVCVWYVSV